MAGLMTAFCSMPPAPPRALCVVTPDVRWLRRSTDVAQLAALQARLLEALWPLLRPGGRLLYCTCSVFRAEGEQQAQTFVTHHKDARLMPSPGHLLPQTGAGESVFPDDCTTFDERAARRGGLGQFQSQDLMAQLMAHAFKLEKYGA